MPVLDSRVNELLSVWEAAPDDSKPSPEELCAAAPELLGRVRACIDGLRSGDRLLERAAADAGADDGTNEQPTPPNIPHYPITGYIGRGGMGVVWLAQHLVVKKAVALKVISAGAHASPRARARFEREMELAARLRHANIAQVFDGGVHEGVPYYVMQLVRGGVPVDRYAEARALTRRQVLELMRPICAAVHHAHQLGVIHRDLKPSNILVDEDDRPVLVDFGLAKEIFGAAGAGGGGASAAAMITLEDAPGTPAYMSPEQATGRADRVGAASDIYSLGVILYGLLLKRLPHDAEGSALAVMHRIATTEPMRPRAVDPRLSRDLEFVLLKALARDPARRYASADAMGRDLQTILDGAPLSDPELGVAYRVRATLRRYRLALLLTATVFLMVGAIAVAAYVRVVRERDRAAEASAVSDAVNKFLLDLLGERDPAQAQGRVPTLPELFERAGDKVGEKFPGQPLVEGAVRGTIGRALLNLAQRDAAEEHLRRAWDLIRGAVGPDDERALDAEATYAYALEGNYKFADARRMQTDLHARRARVQGEMHPDTLMCLHRLGNIAAELAEFDVAEQFFRRTLAARRKVLGPDHVDTIWSMSDLAFVLVSLGRAAEAEPLAREALERRLRVQGADHIDTLNAELCLANTLQVLGRFDEAEALHGENVKRRAKVYGPNHPATAVPSHWMAILRLRQHRPAEAEPFATDALQIRAAADGWAASTTMESLGLLVRALVEQGRLDEARQQLTPAHEALDAPGVRDNRLWMAAYLDALDCVGDHERKSRLEATPGPGTSPASAPVH